MGLKVSMRPNKWTNNINLRGNVIMKVQTQDLSALISYQITIAFTL